MNLTAIIDYGACNLDSISRAVEECGAAPLVTKEAADIERANRIILPGVGAFADGMRNLRERRLAEVLGAQVLDQGIPCLGICLGMQLMARLGTEGEATPGLDWIAGRIESLKPDLPTTRVPHMGWNEVELVGDSPLFKEVPSGKDFYFVHSYHLAGIDEGAVVARTPYCGGFVSAMQRDNLFGVQFHPEKSQKWGFKVLGNFLAA